MPLAAPSPVRSPQSERRASHADVQPHAQALVLPSADKPRKLPAHFPKARKPTETPPVHSPSALPRRRAGTPSIKGLLGQAAALTVSLLAVQASAKTRVPSLRHQEPEPMLAELQSHVGTQSIPAVDVLDNITNVQGRFVPARMREQLLVADTPSFFGALSGASSCAQPVTDANYVKDCLALIGSLADIPTRGEHVEEDLRNLHRLSNLGVPTEAEMLRFNLAVTAMEESQGRLIDRVRVARPVLLMADFDDEGTNGLTVRIYTKAKSIMPIVFIPRGLDDLTFLSVLAHELTHSGCHPDTTEELEDIRPPQLSKLVVESLTQEFSRKDWIKKLGISGYEHQGVLIKAGEQATGYKSNEVADALVEPSPAGYVEAQQGYFSGLKSARAKLGQSVERLRGTVHAYLAAYPELQAAATDPHHVEDRPGA